MIYERPTEIGGIFAPTSTVLTQFTLKEFKKVLDSYGIIQDKHYVVGKRPESYFNYKSKWPEDHYGIWSFSNGCQIKTFSLESFFRGAEFGWAWGDEVQSSSREDLNTVLGRMSGSKIGARTLYTYTPPQYNPDIDEMTYGENAIPGVFGTTYDNERNLPKGYIEMLKNTFDPITFAREVMCERVTAGGRNWLYAFDRDTHVNEIAKYQPDSTVYLSFDFNQKPYVCTLWHKGVLNGIRYIMCFDEIELNPSDTTGQTYIEAMCDVIRKRCPQTPPPRFIVTGDSSGRAGNILSRAGTNAFTEIMKYLKISKGQLVVHSRNMQHNDSQTLCNSVLSNYPAFLINPKCKNLIRDCEFVKCKPDGSIMKDNRSNTLQQADMLDSLRYFIHAFEIDYLRR
jgi:hypothetical protein